MLNHGEYPNMKMVRLDDGISWAANRVIQKKEELTFKYTDPNMKWL